jgi:hypothetical protein
VVKVESGTSCRRRAVVSKHRSKVPGRHSRRPRRVRDAVRTLVVNSVANEEEAEDSSDEGLAVDVSERLRPKMRGGRR